MTETKLYLVEPKPLIPEPNITLIISQYKEFHKAYEVPYNVETQNLYARLIEEEHEEWVETYYSIAIPEYDELKELADLLYVTVGLAYCLGFKDLKATPLKTVKCYDESISLLVETIALGKQDPKILGNLIYCLYGYADAMEWNLDEAFRRVHISNMSKLGEDGKPVRRADGKVMKGPNYLPPDLRDLTNGQ